jgi:lysophospholipase L1-like esterase
MGFLTDKPRQSSAASVALHTWRLAPGPPYASAQVNVSALDREGVGFVLFAPNQRIVFIGDSITDAGRRDPASQPLGSGYVGVVQGFLAARYPDHRLTIVNRGIGGDTVRHLAARWDDDAIGPRPDWLSVKIGINDVWRGFGVNAHESVPLPEYRATLHALLARAREATGCRLIVMEPYLIEPDRTEPMRARMDEYGLAARDVAAALDAVNVRTQAAFDTVLRTTSPADWAADRVHPNVAGHAVIAHAFLHALGVTP